MTAVPSISSECLGWAATARYTRTVDDGAGILMLSAETGTRYYIRHRGDRLEFSEATAGDEPRTVLFAATTVVLERCLYAVMGDEIREDIGLPYLELPSSASEVAKSYQLSDMERGYRILHRIGHGPVAAAPDPQLSLVALVPLSHLLGLTVAAVKRTYLSEHGAPLLANGRYTDTGGETPAFD
ncbi:Imm61 family immunity protein [Mycobacterium dioxanotrophicus]|uniref:Imm61 family immunity protein n=1 Tax=Mycobacterium dioxanotrophicus TaxID=482462 RepID=UPI000B362B61|nr:Imm61 family immunity protein [Mycobacterium dioxanotrophicus]